MPSTDPNVVELEKELGRREALSPEARRRTRRAGRIPWSAGRPLRAAAVLLIAVVALLLYYHNRVSTDDAEVDGHIVPIASKIYGTVAEVMIHDNEAVKAGPGAGAHRPARLPGPRGPSQGGAGSSPRRERRRRAWAFR